MRMLALAETSHRRVKSSVNILQGFSHFTILRKTDYETGYHSELISNLPCTGDTEALLWHLDVFPQTV